LTLILQGAAFAAGTDFPERSGRFLERHSEGWFFYEPIPEPKKEEEKPKEVPVPQTVEVMTLPEPVTTETAAVPPPAPAPLSAEWFRKNLPKYRDVAWNNPSPENVAAYLYVQKLALDRSQKFSDVTEKVVMSTPALDANTRRPVTSFGIHQVDGRAHAMKQAVLKKLSERAGLWFFFSSESPYAAQQADIVNAIAEMYGFSVLPISLDGKPLPGEIFESYQVDQGQAKALGIRVEPAMMLVSAEGTIKSIGEGLISFKDLEERILVIAQLSGLITDEEYKLTQPVLNGDVDIPDQMIRLLQASVQDKDGFIAPDLLLSTIEEASK